MKWGHVTVSQVRDLTGVVKVEGAQIGAFITFDELTSRCVPRVPAPGSTTRRAGAGSTSGFRF